MKDGQALERVRFREFVHLNGGPGSSDIRATKDVLVSFLAGLVFVSIKGNETYVPMSNVAYVWLAKAAKK